MDRETAPPAEGGNTPEPGRKKRRSRRSRKRKPAGGGGGGPAGVNEFRKIARSQFHINDLHPEQIEALTALTEGRDTLAVLPTGHGKSLIYQIFAMLSDQPVITLFPLIALMQDQERSLLRNRVPAVRVDSTLLKREREAAFERIRKGGRLIIMTTPESLESAGMREALGGRKPALLCVDEAHCISEWGHDFRPAYLRVGIERAGIGNPTVLALTATATPKVQDDIVGRLAMTEPKVVAAPPHRENLQLQVRNVPGSIKLTATGRFIRRLRRPGIVYCSTTKAVDEIYVALRRAKIPAERYHGRMTKDERTRAQKRFQRQGVRMVMVATSAFGMGIDKSNIRYIMHYQVPGSVEQYVQEIGRAGRDGKPAQCVLLFDAADLDIQKRLAAKSQVSPAQLENLGEALVAWAETGRGVTVEDLALSAGVVTTACKALCNQVEEAGLLERGPDKLFHARVDVETLRAGVKELAHRFAVAQREDLRRINGIAEYAVTTECRSVFVRRWFGEQDPPPCGKCDHCRPRRAAKTQVVGRPSPDEAVERNAKRDEPRTDGAGADVERREAARREAARKDRSGRDGEGRKTKRRGGGRRGGARRGGARRGGGRGDGAPKDAARGEAQAGGGARSDGAKADGAPAGANSGDPKTERPSGNRSGRGRKSGGRRRRRKRPESKSPEST